MRVVMLVSPGPKWRPFLFDCAREEGNYLQDGVDINNDWERYILLMDINGRRIMAGAKTKGTHAKLFWNGRSQAVRLPKEFRFEGDRVRVRRMGVGVLLEPLPPEEKESVEEWFARIDALRGDPIFPEGRKQNLEPIREYFK